MSIPPERRKTIRLQPDRRKRKHLRWLSSSVQLRKKKP